MDIGTGTISVYDTSAGTLGFQEDIGKFFEENKTGLILAGAGIGVAAVGGIIGNKMGKIVALGGVGILVAGAILIFMKKAGAEPPPEGATGIVSNVIIS